MKAIHDWRRHSLYVGEDTSAGKYTGIILPGIGENSNNKVVISTILVLKDAPLVTNKRLTTTFNYKIKQT